MRVFLQIAGNAPLPQRGEGWGEGAPSQTKLSSAEHPHPTLSLKGEGSYAEAAE